MATSPPTGQPSVQPIPFGVRLQQFWNRVTEGLQVSQLGSQFESEARASYRLYSKDVAAKTPAGLTDQERALILERATAVWLDADVKVLADRVSRAGRRDTRPLLIGRDPLEVLTQLAETRNPIYALAPIHVRSEPLPHEATVEAIIEALPR